MMKAWPLLYSAQAIDFDFKIKLNIFGMLSSYKHIAYITKMNNFQGTIIDKSAKQKHWCSVLQPIPCPVLVDDAAKIPCRFGAEKQSGYLSVM